MMMINEYEESNRRITIGDCNCIGFLSSRDESVIWKAILNVIYDYRKITDIIKPVLNRFQDFDIELK